jgi:hypothetical protein
MRNAPSVIGLGLILATSVVGGCGAAATPATQAPRAPDAVRSLALYVVPSADPNVNSFRATLIDHFVKLGYTVTDVATNADVVVAMTFGILPHKTLFGKPTFDVHVTLTAEGEGLVLGSGTGDITLGSAPSPEQLDLLCSSVMAGAPMENYARKRATAAGGGTGGAGASAGAVGPTAPAGEALPAPGELAECDGDQCDKGNPGTWIFHGMTGVARQPNGAVGDLTIERFDAGGVVIRRVERANSAAAGLTAVYVGKVHDGRVDGTLTATWPGHFPNANPRDVIKGPWFAMTPRTACDAAPSDAQSAMETGGMALRFQKPAPALQCFLFAAKQGNGPAKALVGIMYRDGIGTAVNTAEALQWLKAGAVAGEYNGQVALSQMYEVGMGTPADPAQAQYWKSRALENPAYLEKQKREARAEQQQQTAQSMMFMGLAAVVEAFTAPTVYVRY